MAAWPDWEESVALKLTVIPVNLLVAGLINLSLPLITNLKGQACPHCNCE